MTLVEFLRARLDEDDRAARIAEGNDRSGVRFVSAWLHAYKGIDQQQAHHIARHDPVRVLAEVNAKREIVDLCEASIVGFTDPGEKELARDALVRLALPYADHPDYDEALRP